MKAIQESSSKKDLDLLVIQSWHLSDLVPKGCVLAPRNTHEAAISSEYIILNYLKSRGLSRAFLEVRKDNKKSYVVTSFVLYQKQLDS